MEPEPQAPESPDARADVAPGFLGASRCTGSPASRRRRNGTRWSAGLLASLALFGSFLEPATAQTRASETRPRDFSSLRYWTTGFEIEYGVEDPAQPPIEEILAIQIPLLETPDGFRAPRSVDKPISYRLGDLPAERSRFYTDSLVQINRAILAEFKRRGIGGVIVTLPDVEEGTGRDLRPAGVGRLRLRIWLGHVSDVSTVAVGERFEDLSDADRTNNPHHAWMIDAAPVQAGGERGLLYVDDLDDYAFRLSRQPGRRVDAQLSPGNGPASTRVTLRVAENRPWLAYAQYSNTGTSTTSRNRERFGFVHNQLSGHDDILRIDYVTGDFQFMNALYGSYETPLWRRDGPRLRLGSSITRYDSSEIAFEGDSFRGSQAHVGLDYIHPVYQRRDFFVDVFAGLKWQYQDVRNEVFSKAILVDTHANYLLPRVGFDIERLTYTSQLRLTSFFELGFTNDSELELQDFGRVAVESEFSVFRWNGVYSFFLEPLVNPAGWRDPSTPFSSTLAHEMALSYSGQWAMGNRLIPQQQMVIGGLFTVRGYSQALVAGDTVHVATLEYRFHLPRVFRPSGDMLRVPVLGNFRTSPPNVYGMPDWDFILKGFVDFGNAAFVDPMVQAGSTNERQATLLGVGVGAELDFMRYLTARLDVGFALDSAGGRAEYGSYQLHGLVTVRY